MSSRYTSGHALSRRRRKRHQCFDPELRGKLALEDHSRPGYVFHLYISSQEEGEPPSPPRLWRTYTSYALANHDALCWVLQQQLKAGAKDLTYMSDHEYEREYEGRCSRIHTNWNLSKELGKLYCASTTEARLF